MSMCLVTGVTLVMRLLTPSLITGQPFPTADLLSGSTSWRWTHHGRYNGYGRYGSVNGKTYGKKADYFYHRHQRPSPRTKFGKLLSQQTKEKPATSFSNRPNTLLWNVQLPLPMFLSLLPSTTGVKASGVQGKARLEALQRAFYAAKAHIVGLQETRMRKECRVEQELYYVLSSAATSRGHFGVQLWFSRTLRIGEGDGKEYKFQREHLKIVARNPRYLVVKVNAPFLRAIVISAHGLTSQSPPEEITSWWRNLKKSIPTRYATWPHILAADANGRLGDITSCCVGDHDADPQDHAGAELHDFVQEANMWLPATFSSFHEGSSGTWTHPKTGQWIRGDYIGVPRQWKLDSCYSSIVDVDLALTREDHRAPGVTLSWKTPTTSEIPRLRVATLDTGSLSHDLASSSRKATLQALEHCIPEVTWDTDVHSHTYALQSALQRWTQRHYMKGPRRPMRKHLTEETWQLILEKKNQRNFLHHYNLARRLQLMLACFQRWAKIDEEVGLWEDFEESKTAAIALWNFRQLGRKVTRALRNDDRIFFDTLATETGEMDALGQTKALWDRIRWSLPKTKAKGMHNPLMMECLDDQWIPHFAKLEAGFATSGPELLQQCASRQACSRVVVEEPTTSLQDLPTRFEVEKTLRSLQPNRAPGPDAISSTLLRGTSVTMAKPVHDLFCKMSWWTSEPVQFKGGHMLPIFKRGHEEDAACYRGIMLLSSLSKAFHALVRKQLISEIANVKVDSQIGGFGGQQAVFGSHSIQSIAKLAHHHQKPSACLFVDIQGAYHFLVRQLVVGHIDGEDETRIINNLMDWKADVQGIQHWLRLPGVLQRARFPPKLIQFLKELHTDTWSKLPHISTFLRTSRGSRPGSPLADAVYAALMMDLHIEIYRLLEACEEVQKGFDSIGTTSCAVTWADDLAVPIVVESNELLVPTITNLTAKIYHAFENRGLLLNLGKGKTAAVLAFRGPFARSHRAQYLLHPHPGAQVQLRGGRKVWLNFNCSYRHLGAIYVPDGEVVCEVQGRLGQARTAFLQMKRAVFGNRHLAIKTRMRLFESLVVSRLCYGISAWGHIPVKTIEKIEAFLSRCFRYICSASQTGGPSNDYLQGHYRLPTLTQRLSFARITYAIRVWSVGPETLKSLLNAEHAAISTSWWGYLLEDLRWCKELAGTHLPIDNLDPDQLQASWRSKPAAWMKAARKALRVGILQESTAADVREWHRQCLKVLTQHGATFTGLEGDRGDRQQEDFHCACGRSFSSIQGLTSHRRRAHQYQAPEARLVGSLTSCPHCLKFLWTPSRVKQHLAYIPRDGTPNVCYEALMRRGFEAPTEEKGEKGNSSLGHTYGINRRDALQAEGPLPQHKDEIEERIQIAETELMAALNIYDQRFNEENVDLQFVEQISEKLSRSTRHWFQEGPGEAEGSFDHGRLQDRWKNVLSDEEAEDATATVFLAWGREILPSLWATWDSGVAEAAAEQAFYEAIRGSDIMEAEIVINKARMRLRGIQAERQADEHSQPHRPVRYGPLYKRGDNKTIRPLERRYRDGDGWHTTWCKSSLVDSIKDVEMPFYKQLQGRKVYLVLHLFSGRRRKEDFHDYLMEMSARANFDIRVLSLDTAVDEELGNLQSGGRTWQEVDNLLKGGHIAAGVAGSPCETFSAARGNPPPDDIPDEVRRRWPRPLRSTDDPWGLDGLWTKEIRQLATGSRLALQTIYALTWILVTGGSFLSEHPAPPQDPSLVSIFRVPLVRLIRQIPEVSLAVINQGDYGAGSTKPTGLLRVRVPALYRSFAKWKSPTPVSERTLAIGKDLKGNFRTSRLKEYPSAFSHGLAQSIFDAIAGKHRSSRDAELKQQSPWLSEALTVSEQIRADAQMMPDYQNGKGWNGAGIAVSVPPRFWLYWVALIGCLQRAVSSIATMEKKISNHVANSLFTFPAYFLKTLHFHVISSKSIVSAATMPCELLVYI